MYLLADLKDMGCFFYLNYALHSSWFRLLLLLLQQKKYFWKKIYCQICVLSNNFYGFEKEAKKIRYNIPELRKYFDRFKKETIRRYYDHPFACEVFLNREHNFCGRDFSEGTRWSVSLS